jgi:UPF0755 protein
MEPLEPTELTEPDGTAGLPRHDEVQRPVAEPVSRADRHGDAATRRELRRESRRRRRRIVLGVAAVLVVVVAAFTIWYELESHALGSEGPQEVVDVANGESVSAMVSSLAHEKVIGSTLAFRFYDLVHGSPTVIPGSYALRQNESFAKVSAILNGGPNIFPVVVQPGLSLSEVAQRVDNVPGHANPSFAKVAASGVVHSAFSPPGSNDLEGLVGTGTYLVVPGESDTTVLRDMVSRFDSQATAAGVSTATASALGLTTYQMITAASIVEKEGYITKNMPQVARVIYNRLATGMPLQMDSTVLYALGQDGGTVTAQDLQLQSPYNTYLNHGLTPTPICTPSITALDSAAHPPTGAWLYFVLVEKNGTEAFSDTIAEQLANENLAKSRGLG